DYYLEHGQLRAAARAQSSLGGALGNDGRFTEARTHLTAALEALRPDPDGDTVHALERLATLEVFAGSPDADQLTAEAVILGQARDVGPERLANLFEVRGIWLGFAERRSESVAYFTQAARLAEQAKDSRLLANVLGNLADVLSRTDPAAAAEA